MRERGGTSAPALPWSSWGGGCHTGFSRAGHGHGNDATWSARLRTFGQPAGITITFHKTAMATRKTGIADIPVELLIDNLLPFCDAKDAFSLGCTNKFFALITTDDMFWKRRLAADYNFTGSETARTSGWKFIYQRLRRPRVFVWGYVIFHSFVLRGSSVVH